MAPDRIAAARLLSTWRRALHYHLRCMRPPDVLLTDGIGRAPLADSRLSLRARSRGLVRSHQHALTLLLVLAGVLTLYLKTAAPGAYSFDAAELSLAAATWGIPHATGYPLFLLLGRLFVAFPSAGDPAYRMAVATALFGALTVMTLFAILRELRIGLVASLLAAAAFGISYYQWGSAVITKEHSLHDWLLALTLWLLLRWRRDGLFGWLLAATGAYSLSLTNHLAAALYAPVLVAFVIAQVRSGSARMTAGYVVALLAIGLAGLLPYLYLPLAYVARPAYDIAGQFDASGIYHPVNLASVPGMVWMLSGRQFGSAILGSTLSDLPGQAWQLVLWWWGNFFGIGIVLGLAGLWPFLKAQRDFFWLTVVLAVVHAAFFVTYAVADRYNMFVPVYLLWSIPLAYGIRWVAQQLDSPRGAAAVYGLLACGVIVAAAGNYRLLDLSSDHRPGDWAKNLLARAPENATILTRWAFSGPLRYEQIIDGMRPDVLVIDSFLITRDDLAKFVQTNVDRRPLIIDDPNLFTSPDGYQGICASQLAGPTISLEPPSKSGDPDAHFQGYRLVRCVLPSTT